MALNQNYRGGYNNPHQQNFNEPFKSEWITTEITKETVDFADKLGSYVKNNGLTTSQIRNVFGEIKRIQMKGFDSQKASFYLLKPKMAYAAKRHEKPGLDGINTLKRYFDSAHKEVTDAKTYQNFVDFFESILAYHKAYGGKD